MKELTYNERIAVMRILWDIIMADNKIDDREQSFFDKIALSLDLKDLSRADLNNQSSLLALTLVSGFNQEQKERFAKLMGQMITVDENINYNEVKIYNVVNEFCDIKVDFRIDDYPQYFIDKK